MNNILNKNTHKSPSPLGEARWGLSSPWGRLGWAGFMLRLTVALLLLFALQKVFFMAMTWQEGTTIGDVMNVVWHGLRLDLAVCGYVLVLPWLVLMIDVVWPNRITSPLLRIYLIIIALVMSIIIVADASLYNFWHFKLDASVFLYTDKPKDAVASVSMWYIVTRLLMIAAWGAVIIKSLLLPLKGGGGERPYSKKWLPSLGGVVGGLLLFLIIRGGIGKGTNNVSMAYYSENQYLNHCALNPVFNLMYSMGKQEDFASEAQYFNDDELKDIISEIYTATPSHVAEPIISKPRDILLIIWEGAGLDMLERYKCGTELDRIAKDGIVFTQCYANSFRTDRGQLSLLAGWPAIPKTSLMKIPEKCERLSALPRTLLNNGYETTFWYGGDISFANTGGYMHQAGFRHIVSDKDFPRSEHKTDWGVYDETLLESLYQSLSSRSTTDDGKSSKRHPSLGGAGGGFFDVVMTLTSHEPWKTPVKKLENERANAFYYTDQCIGNLIKKLRKSPQWDNLLVIITADHGALDIGDSEYHHPKITHIPMVWTGGAVKQPMNIDRIMNQSDLAATLLAQMDIRHDEFIFSRDILSPDYTYPCAFHAYNGGISFVDSTGYTTYDIDGNHAILNANAVRERKAKGILQYLYRKIAEL